MDEPEDITLSEKSWSQKDKHCQNHRDRNCTHGRQGLGREEESSWLMDTKLQIDKMKRLMRMDGGDGCTIM